MKQEIQRIKDRLSFLMGVSCSLTVKNAVRELHVPEVYIEDFVQAKITELVNKPDKQWNEDKKKNITPAVGTLVLRGAKLHFTVEDIEIVPSIGYDFVIRIGEYELYFNRNPA